MNIEFEIGAGLTPTALKLYQFVASSSLPVSISFADFQQICSLNGVIMQWQSELERICRELNNANMVTYAYVSNNAVHVY